MEDLKKGLARCLQALLKEPLVSIGRQEAILSSFTQDRKRKHTQISFDDAIDKDEPIERRRSERLARQKG